MHFRPLDLAYLDIFHSVLLMKLKEFLASNCCLQCMNKLLGLVSPTWKLRLCTAFSDWIMFPFFLTSMFYCIDISCIKLYKTLLGFLNSEYSPGKEIQPFRLPLVLYRLAGLGFRKQNRPMVFGWNVGTERMPIFERLLCLICLPNIIFITYDNIISNA